VRLATILVVIRMTMRIQQINFLTRNFIIAEWDNIVRILLINREVVDEFLFLYIKN